MIDLEEIKELLKNECDKMQIELVSVDLKNDPEFGKIIEIRVDKDYSIDIDTIDKFTEKVSPLFDNIGDENESFTLDISSPGSEREIPFLDVSKLIGRYLDIKLKDNKEITCKVESADSEKIKVYYFIKGKKKTLTLTSDDIKSIHMGYKA